MAKTRCKTCDDDGYVDIVGDMGEVIGPAPCPDCGPLADVVEAIGKAAPVWESQFGPHIYIKEKRGS